MIAVNFKIKTIVITTHADDVIQKIAEKKHGQSSFAKSEAISIKQDLIKQHIRLKQGTLCASDHQQNLDAVKRNDNGELLERIFSSFEVDGIKFWVITEWDESVTTILLPEDY